MKVDEAALERPTAKWGTPREMPQTHSLVVGLTAVVYSALYFISDLMEVAQDEFSTARAASAGIRDLAFVAMGASLLIRRTRLGAAPPLPLPGGGEAKGERRAS